MFGIVFHVNYIEEKTIIVYIKEWGRLMGLGDGVRPSPPAPCALARLCSVWARVLWRCRSLGDGLQGCGKTADIHTFLGRSPWQPLSGWNLRSDSGYHTQLGFPL
jgi:hypothetical protein